MRALMFVLLVLLAAAAPAQPAPAQGFWSVALHDVVDKEGELDADAITTDRLVAFLDWLVGNGYTAISLDDVESARRGERQLPPRAVLLTVDDGYSSLYTRIFPLALAYRMPVVAALVTSWLDVPPQGSVRYGDAEVPRSRFISWEQAREMQASGWIEFASHSDALHQGVLANPQGNLLPAAVTRRYLAEGRYEDAAAWRERIATDLRHSRERMAAELGRAPRALVWPYGRYSAGSVEIAGAAGFRYALTLDGGPASAGTPMAIARFLSPLDPRLYPMVAMLEGRDPWPAARRLVCVDPAAFASPDAAETDARLGRAIERLRRLGATHVVIDAAASDKQGGLAAAWFPTSQLPMRADLLARLAAQMRGRAEVRVALRLPHAAALASLREPERVLRLYEDLASHVSFDALLVEDAPALGTASVAASGVTPPPRAVAAVRRAMSTVGWPARDLLALRAFEAAESWRPGIELFWLADPGWPWGQAAAGAELTLVPRRVEDAPPPAPALRAPASRRLGVWWQQAAVPDAGRLAAATRQLQGAGVTALGWCPDDALADAPAAAVLAPAWSAAGFPLRGVRP